MKEEGQGLEIRNFANVGRRLAVVEAGKGAAITSYTLAFEIAQPWKCSVIQAENDY